MRTYTCAFAAPAAKAIPKSVVASSFMIAPLVAVPVLPVVLPHLLVLLFLIIVQNRLDLRIAIIAQSPRFGMAILRR